MKRTSTWKWIFFGAGVFFWLILIAAILVLRTQRFHEFVLARIEQKAQESIGGRVEIRDYRFHWRNLSADVYGLTIHGREQAGTQPLLQMDRLFVDVKVVSVFKREVDLNEIIVQRPVIHFVSYPDGTTNLPKPKSETKSSNTSIFDLGIKHVLLTDGEIYYEQRKQSLFADVRDLRTNINYESPADLYRGVLSYEQGEIRLGNSRPLPHALQANFTATRNRAKLESATLTMGGSKLWMSALLENYNTPRVSGTYRLQAHPQDFRDVLQQSDLPTGDINLEGSLNYDSSDPRPLMRVLLAEGKLTSRDLLINTSQARANIRETVGRFVLRDGKFTASLRSHLLTGQLTATLDMTGLDSTPTSYVKASLMGISLADARSALRSAKARDLPITGKVDAYSEASWTGPIKTLKAKADLAVKGAVSQTAESGVVPVNGAAHMNYDGRSNIITLTNTIFRTPQSTITLNGQLSRHSRLKIAARTEDIRELNEIVSSLNSSTNSSGTSSGTQPSLVSGPATMTAAITGDMQRPEIAGNLSAHDLTIQGDQWKALNVDFQASPSKAAIARGLIVATGSGQATFTGSVALKNWSYSPQNPIAANMQVRGMQIRSLQHAAGVNYPISGTLSADLNLKGSQDDPSGTGNVHVQQARAYGQTVRDVLLKFNAANRTVHSDLAVQTPAGNLNGRLAFRPDTKTYEVHLKAPGVTIADLDAVRARDVPIDGRVTLSADGAGSLDDPQLQAAIEIPSLKLRDSTLQGVRTDLQVANHRANLTLDSNFANAGLRGKGTVDLRGDYPADITIDTRAIPIETLVALYKPVPNRDFHGLIELHATAKGPLKNKDRMEVHLTIPTLRAQYQNIQISNPQPIRADYQNAVLHLQPGELQGTGTSVRFEGTIPAAKAQPATLNLTGNIDLQIVRLISPDIQSRGTVLLDLRANRNAGNLGIAGQVRLNKVALATLSSPMAVQNLNGVLEVQNNQVRITDFQGQTGGGTFTAGGTVTYRPQLVMDVSLNAKSVRVRYPEGVRAVIDSQLALSGTQQSSTLTGRVLLNSLGFTGDFDLAKFMGQFSGQPTSAPTPGMAQNMKLDVAVQSTSNLQLVSSELSLEGQVNLTVRGTAAQPVIVGRTTLSNGDVFFRNRRYRLERGILDFTNPNETKPNVNILITTLINQYNLSLTLLGPVDRLRTTYVSDPPLPPVDIINLIARGTTTEETTATNFDANAVLAQGLASQVSSRLQKFAGLSSLQIDPTIGGGNDNPGARIAIQQRVTRNFIFTFSTDVTNAQREVVQGEYQLNPRWSVSAQRDENGGYAFDAKYHSVF